MTWLDLTWLVCTSGNQTSRDHLKQCEWWCSVIADCRLSPLTPMVVRVPPMISQRAAAFSVCLLQPSVTLESPVLSILWCCLPTACSCPPPPSSCSPHSAVQYDLSQARWSGDMPMSKQLMRITFTNINNALSYVLFLLLWAHRPVQEKLKYRRISLHNQTTNKKQTQLSLKVRK